MIYDLRGSETHTTLFKTRPYGICPATTRMQPLVCLWMAPLTCLVRHTMPLAEYTVSRGGGTYAAERRIGYKALRRAGLDPDEARRAIQEADDYFRGIGVTPSTTTGIPRDRK